MAAVAREHNLLATSLACGCEVEGLHYGIVAAGPLAACSFRFLPRRTRTSR